MEAWLFKKYILFNFVRRGYVIKLSQGALHFIKAGTTLLKILFSNRI